MKRTAFILSALLAVLLLAACSAAADFSPAAPGNAATQTFGDTGNAQMMFRSASPQAENWAVLEAADMAVYSDRGAGMEGGLTSASPAPGRTSMAERIIYTASADIETMDFDETIERVHEMLGIHGAFIENSFIGGRNHAQAFHGWQTFRTANFTIRIPVERFETVTGGLDILGNVTSIWRDAENITMQFMDTESRLNAFRIQEERLLDMLSRADTMADMILIEARLGEVRFDIESLTSMLQNWQSRIDYSTLTLHIREVERLTPITPTHRTYWQRVGDGFRSTARGIGEFFTDAFAWLIARSLVIIIVIVVIGTPILIIVTKHRRRVKLNALAYEPDDE